MSKHTQDAYTKEFETTIRAVGDGHVELEETYFYPVGGGQPADTGHLELADGTRIDITHTQRKNGSVAHHADTQELAPGMHVTARIDWPRRHKLMRMHTAAHIISRIIADEEDALITGNQLSADESRIDFDLDEYDKERILAYEERINQELAKHHDVSTKTLPREEADEELERLSGLKAGLPAHITQVRIVRIGDADAQACAGTHVKNTKEVGAVTLTRTKNKGSSHRRVYFTLS